MIRSICFYIALVCLAISAVHAQEVLDGIAAVVNEDVITFSQVRDLVGPKEKSARESLKGQALIDKVKEIRLQAVNDLIDRQLILQDFKGKKFTIPPHVLDERIEAITREEFGGDRSAFVRTLAAQGFTLDKFKQMEMDKIIVSAMRSQLVKPNAVVPEAGVRDYYQRHLEEYTSEEQIKVRMLMLRRGETPEIRKKMMEEIRQKIVAGAAFEDMARLYSEDPTQESGGDWGWINRKTLAEPLTKVAFSLKPGEVSKIADLGGNYYLLFCEARKPQVVKPLAELRDEIEKKLVQEERQKAQAEWIAKLRAKAFIKIY